MINWSNVNYKNLKLMGAYSLLLYIDYESWEYFFHPLHLWKKIPKEYIVINEVNGNIIDITKEGREIMPRLSIPYSENRFEGIRLIHPFMEEFWEKRKKEMEEFNPSVLSLLYIDLTPEKEKELIDKGIDLWVSISRYLPIGDAENFFKDIGMLVYPCYSDKIGNTRD